MHPDVKESYDITIESNSIPADWLKTIKWNRDVCLESKETIERNVKYLTQFRRKYQFDRSIYSKIRSLENAIVRDLAKLIFVRRKFKKWEDNDDLRDFSLLAIWFKAIGLDNKSIELLSNQYEDIEELLNADDEELRILMLRGFNLEIDISYGQIDCDSQNCIDSKIDSNQDKWIDGNCLKRCDNVEKSNTNNLKTYVNDYIRVILKAQHSLHQCLDKLGNSIEISSTEQLCWDSWNHWINQADEDQKELIKSLISSLTKKSRHLSQPLPPLPDLKTIFLKNLRDGSTVDSRSTGSSPLSPPYQQPLSASNLSHRSISSSSSSIVQQGFHVNNQSIFDPNHITPTQRCPTPPPTRSGLHHKRSFILSSASLLLSNSSSKNSDRKFPTTPPPIRRHQTNNFGSKNFPLTKSKSHEEHLSNRIEPLDPLINSKLIKKFSLAPLSTKPAKNNKHNSWDNLPHIPNQQQRRRLATEPGSIGSISPILTSSNCSSPIAISPENQAYSDKQTSDICFFDSVPRSPRSQAMSHSIHHRFVSTMKINSIQCNVCEKQMFFGFKCRDCKYYCHRDCQDKAPNSCGLPIELMDLFKKTLSEGQTRSSSPKNLPKRARSQLNYYSSQINSNSSSNPSSPALFNHSSSSSTTISPTENHKLIGSQFQFPPNINITSTISIDYEDADQNLFTQNSSDVNEDSGNKSISTIQEEEELIIGTTSSSSSVFTNKPLIDSDKSINSCLVTSGSSGDSVRTVTGHLDSQDSQASDLDQNEQSWSRQNSVTSKEWDIPYDELKIEDEIGIGRFGTVYRGKWHGSVAIKQLIMGENDLEEERKAFEVFKQEVAIFKKTRHENLVLFMGACMKPPHLAIVTSLCKGLTLHTHIHIRHDKFNLNRKIMIAEQICLGIGYLHAREIIHKDLKTKNIFYENGKVIITDFGLSSVARLCVPDRRKDWLTVPQGWLCYLAPEIVRTLSVYSQESSDSSFSFKTDVYAFGTVWFELLFGSWPFSQQPPEVIIWQVGKGIKQPIINFQSSKEIKDILYACWAFNPDERPDFIKLYESLERLPKKRLQRSPSHPAHLQHSSELAFI
ncbi:hypothetical protein NH340_JMT01042 [Sarcoptes scabiei]|nr:hypothetical protein NH340_JMT01042 [Sarcoptes scabiei]